MKQIYFVRHGESLHNTLAVASGSIDSPLTKKGLAQASEAGKRARDEGLVFDVIISSPLKRAHNTAQKIAEHINYPIQKIELHPDLRERHFGEMEGKTLEDFGVTPEIFVVDPYSIDHVPDIEKIEELQKRADEMYKNIQSLPHEKILIVSHGAFGRALSRSVKNLPITEFGDRIDNAKIIKLV